MQYGVLTPEEAWPLLAGLRRRGFWLMNERANLDQTKMNYSWLHPLRAAIEHEQHESIDLCAAYAKVSRDLEQMIGYAPQPDLKRDE